MRESFDASETHELEEELRSGSVLLCPRCEVPLDTRAIPPRQDVSYVRDRVWLSCPECQRSAVLDRKPGV